MVFKTDEKAFLEELEALEALAQRKQYRRIDFFAPYAKQQEFIDLGSCKRERLLMAGNQTGKSETGAYECAMHLTGLYPDDWLGRKWNRPVKAWASGVTSLSTRDIIQKKLMGEPGVKDLYGTGMIPKDLIVDTSLARGVTDLFDTITVRHVSGGVSILKLKSYEQGRQKWQGDTVDFVWFDEEPEEDIYSEGLTRITATGGMVYMTFTPLLGMSKVVMRFLNEASPDRGVVSMTIDDALHVDPEERERIIAGYTAHEREARAKGIPLLGSGRIFQVTEELIREPAIQHYPSHWCWLWGLDFGIHHPGAGVLIAWDRDADIVHVVHAFKMKDMSPMAADKHMKPFGWIKVAWPQDGHQRDTGNLQPLAKQFKAAGLRMLDHHATFPDGSNSTEAGIAEMDERFKTGRLKVAEHLSEWFEEFRMYHRKDGLIVKLHDDIMSATRVAVMAKRYASMREPKPSRHDMGAVAKDVDFDVFG